MNKLLPILLILIVFLAGCTSQTETPIKETADTTEESISQGAAIDSDLNDEETKDISSDFDQVIDTLG